MAVGRIVVMLGTVLQVGIGMIVNGGSQLLCTKSGSYILLYLATS
jgi:hypothetical protein